jgi:RloB-like protein
MSRPKTRLPARVSQAQPFGILVFADGGNEYQYLEDSGALKNFKKGNELPSTQVKAIVQKIKSNLDNDAIDQIYWIVDGGDEHNQGKEFKKFYIEWRENTEPKKQKNSWLKLKIIINHPCLEYWFLLHKSEPPRDPTKNNFTVFSYHNKQCPSPCEKLQEHTDFKTNFSDYKKSGSNINEIATDKVGRNKAISRARALDAAKPTEITLENIFTYPCAEIYQLFEKCTKG